MATARYVMRFGGSKNEVDLEGVFLQAGGTLGGAAARDDTDFGLTHAERATKTLLTEKHVGLELPLSEKLVASSAALFKEETGADGVEGAPGVGEILLLSDRTQLLGTSSRMGASINGTWAHTGAGYTTAPLSSLFTTTDTSALTADADKENATIGAIAARVAAPFSMLSMKYPNWEAVQAVVGTNQPVIVRVAEDGTETPVSVAFFTPNKQAARLAQVEPLLKAIYDKAWALTESVPYAPSPTLTKSVMRKPYGLNGSPYALAAEANDTPNAMTDETLESALSRAIEGEVQGAHRHAQLLDDLRTPSFQSTLVHGKSVATAISAMCAFLVPYRVDGTPVAAPTGLLMRETESWPIEPLRKIEQAEADLYRVAEGASTGNEAQSFRKAAFGALEVVQAAMNSGGRFSGKTTGLDTINDKTSGLHNSDLVILAGRPAMGKTSLATNIAFNAARRRMDDEKAGIDPEKSPGAGVAFFSLEMSADQLATRILAEQAEISSEKLRSGKLSREEFQRLSFASQELTDLPLYIDDTPALTIGALARAAGCPGDRIVFDGPAKTDEELRAALDLGCWLNADHPRELERLAALGAPGDARVGVRVNPEIGAGSIGFTSTVAKGSKFGVPLRDAPSLRDRFPFLTAS